jgi:AcrR family transcriptional regulator
VAEHRLSEFPKRLSQAERSAATREKIMQAVIECLAEDGLHNATAARIVERSGYTWGAIAHHFGDKNSVLLAAVERSMQGFAEVLRNVAETHPSTRARVSYLVDRVWRSYAHPSFGPILEVMINGQTSSDDMFRAQYTAMMVKLMDGIWTDLFGDLDIDATMSETARRFMFTTLLGMRIETIFEQKPRDFTGELELLKQFVVQLLDTGSHVGS